jgi:hypothetical protein
VSVLNMQLPTALMSDVADDLYSARQQLRVRPAYRGLPGARPLCALQRSKQARVSGGLRIPVIDRDRPVFRP